MRWNERLRSGERLVPAVALFLLLIWPPSPQAQPAAPERLSVYAPRGSFSVLLQPYAGREYVGVLDLLDPLGELSARQDGRKWKVRFNGVDLEFEAYKTRVKVGGKRLEIGAPFYFQDGRGMIPLA